MPEISNARKKVLFIVGSLRKGSFNRQLADKAAALLSDCDVSFLDYRDVPFMDQDLEDPVLPAVARVRGEVAAADLVWIFTPEYNHSYPGVLKNLLDWLSRPVDPADRKSPSVLRGKPVMMSGAAGQSAALHSRTKLMELASLMGMELLHGTGTGVVLGREAFMSGLLTPTPEEELELSAQAAELERL